MTERFKNTRLVPSSRWSTELITGAGQQWQHFYCLNRNLLTWMNIWKYWANVPNHLIQRYVEGNPDLWNITSVLFIRYKKKINICNSTLCRPNPLRRYVVQKCSADSWHRDIRRDRLRKIQFLVHSILLTCAQMEVLQICRPPAYWGYKEPKVKWLRFRTWGLGGFFSSLQRGSRQAWGAGRSMHLLSWRPIWHTAVPLKCKKLRKWEGARSFVKALSTSFQSSLSHHLVQLQTHFNVERET